MDVPALPGGPPVGGLRRVDRWLRREGRDLAPISFPAAQLLDRRLRVRSRALAVSAPFALLALAAFVMSAVTANLDVPGTGNNTAVRYWMAAVVLMVASVLVLTAGVSRGERALAEQLPDRVRGDHAEPVWRQLGVARAAGVSLVVVANICVLGALVFFDASVRLLVVFVVALLVVLVCVGVTVWRLVCSLIVAVDHDSFVIDQRMRGHDLFLAVVPLLLLAAAFGNVIYLFDGTRGHVGFIAVFGPLLMPAFISAEVLAQSRAGRPRETAHPTARWT